MLDHHMGDSVVTVPADVRASDPWHSLYGPHRASYVKCYDDAGPTYVMTARGGRILQHQTLVHQGKADAAVARTPSDAKRHDAHMSDLRSRLDARMAAWRESTGLGDPD